MQHEPFYETKACRMDELGTQVAWIDHKDSFSDCMPSWNEAKDVCLLFSGENFPDPAHLTRMQRNGYAIDPDRAGYLIHLYEEMGLRFLELLNGWFSGVILDLRTKKVILFNDRFGLGRIYFHEDERGFHFSSEAKALLRVLPTTRQLDDQALAEVAACGTVLQDRTLFKGIKLLPAGSCWVFTPGRSIHRDRYFDPATWEQLPPISATEYMNRLQEVFAQILPGYLRGHSRIGISLTGGLDCRMIMSWARSSSSQLPCYSFASSYRDCVDVRLARKVAAACNQPHTTIVVGEEFVSDFPRYAEKSIYISDGAMDVTGAVELYVNERARAISPIRMTGNYGSEILRSTMPFRPGRSYGPLLAPEFTTLVEKARNTFGREIQGHPLSFIAFKQVPWHHYKRFSVERSQITPRSPFLNNSLVALAYQAPVSMLQSREASFRLIQAGSPQLGMIPTDRGFLPHPIPVLTSARNLWQEFWFKAEYAYDYGMPQWVAGIDHWLAPLRLERMFLGRHKFYHFRLWYRDQLSGYLRQILLDSRTLNRPYFNRRTVETIVTEHTRGQRNHTDSIHMILTTELIHRTLLESRN